MSMRSLADFNGSSPGGAVMDGTATVTARGLKLPADTTNEGWGLLTGHQRGPRPGHIRGLSHGHGQAASGSAVRGRGPRMLRRTRTLVIGSATAVILVTGGGMAIATIAGPFNNRFPLVSSTG